MRQMPAESVDLVVTSPPYNIKNSTGNGLKCGRGGKWVNLKGDITLRVCADNDKIRILHDEKEVAWWDSNELVGIASAKLRNILYVNAEALPDGRIKFTEAQIFETFAPLNFIRALNEGTVAIDFDARSNPNKNSIRNHGTKFRIRERDILKIYQNILPL